MCSLAGLVWSGQVPKSEQMTFGNPHRTDYTDSEKAFITEQARARPRGHRVAASQRRARCVLHGMSRVASLRCAAADAALRQAESAAALKEKVNKFAKAQQRVVELCAPPLGGTVPGLGHRALVGYG